MRTIEEHIENNRVARAEPERAFPWTYPRTYIKPLESIQPPPDRYVSRPAAHVIRYALIPVTDHYMRVVKQADDDGCIEGCDGGDCACSCGGCGND